jgi:hypothetical protein
MGFGGESVFNVNGNCWYRFGKSETLAQAEFNPLFKPTQR